MVLWSFFVLVSTGLGQSENRADFPLPSRVLILSVTGTHYPAITRALSTVGFEVQEISAKDYESPERERPGLLVVPEKEGEQLDSSLVKAILADVEKGRPLLADGSNSLTSSLGVKMSGAHNRIARYQWERYAKNPIRLPHRVRCVHIEANPDLQTLADEPRHDFPLVVSGTRGEGRFILSAIPLEPKEGMVFQYLPFLAQAIVDELNSAPTLAADNLCAYADFGGEPRVDPVQVAAQLKQWSVREVHLGAFYQSATFLEFLPRFLAAAHQQGIAVYAWLEYPMVSQEFWDKHPEWREVTASGRRAILDWRLHMALEDPACFQAVADLTRRLVLDYDWDGVDFAELYFEAERDIFRHPGDFTPMHPTFRKMFEQRYGVDPITLFERGSPNFGPGNSKLRREMADYRVELITELTRKFMEVLMSCREKKPYLQTNLTFIDALRDPTVTERYGVDPLRLLALQQKYGFAVEVEDPYTVWNSASDRYRAIGEYYRPRLQPGTPFSIDVNVVKRNSATGPLSRPRGLELYELLSNVASQVDLVTLYAYSTFSADDMRLVPFVLAGQQSVIGREGEVTAKRQVYWRADTRGRAVYLDGQLWPCRSDSQVLIPAGVHRVDMRADSAGENSDALRIENVNGTVLRAKEALGRVSLTYESRGRCYVILNRAPKSVRCDGVDGVGQILANGGSVCLVLPQGKHRIDLE
jgi:hypothetical protein